MNIDPTEWTLLVSRVAALEARDADLAGQITALRAQWDKLEARLYGLVLAGTLGGSGASAVIAHFVG